MFYASIRVINMSWTDSSQVEVGRTSAPKSTTLRFCHFQLGGETQPGFFSVGVKEAGGTFSQETLAVVIIKIRGAT